MADFITNTAGTKSVNISVIGAVEVAHVIATETTPAHWSILVYSSQERGNVIEFESEETEEAAMTKMSALLDLLV